MSRHDRVSGCADSAQLSGRRHSGRNRSSSCRRRQKRRRGAEDRYWCADSGELLSCEQRSPLTRGRPPCSDVPNLPNLVYVVRAECSADPVQKESRRPGITSRHSNGQADKPLTLEGTDPVGATEEVNSPRMSSLLALQVVEFVDGAV